MITEERVRDALHGYAESVPPGRGEALARTRQRVAGRRRRNRSASIAGGLTAVVIAAAIAVLVSGGRDRAHVETKTDPAQQTTATMPAGITDVVVFDEGRCIDDDTLAPGQPTPCNGLHTTEEYAEFVSSSPTGTVVWLDACRVLFERYSGRSIDQESSRYDLVVAAEGSEAAPHVRCMIRSSGAQTRGSARRSGQ